MITARNFSAETVFKEMRKECRTLSLAAGSGFNDAREYADTVEATNLDALLKWSPWFSMAEKSRPAGLDPDTERMLRFKEGDLEAFEDLFTRHVRAVTNFAFRFVRRREIAEELAQEVFLRVNDSVSSYRPEAKFTTWLYRIATNVCLNEIRRPQYRAVHTSLDDNGSEHASGRPMELADPARVGPDRMLERDTVVRALRQALDGLPQNQRLAFILNKYQELSYVEVAAVMKVSEKAVKSLIHRAKEAMAERLRPQLPELL